MQKNIDFFVNILLIIQITNMFYTSFIKVVFENFLSVFLTLKSIHKWWRNLNFKTKLFIFNVPMGIFYICFVHLVIMESFLLISEIKLQLLKAKNNPLGAMFSEIYHLSRENT